MNVDSVPVEWLQFVILQLYGALTDEPNTTFVVDQQTTTPNISIMSSKNKEYYNDDGFRRYLQHELDIYKNRLPDVFDKIENIYDGSSDLWSFTNVPDDSSPYYPAYHITIMHPSERVAGCQIPYVLARALGYGSANTVSVQIASVHTTFTQCRFTVADQMIINFLYNAELNNGMTKDDVVPIFREWTKSEPFKALFSR